MVDGINAGLADANPQPTELLIAKLGDDRAQAVVAPGRPAFTESQLAVGEREVVGHDEHLAQGCMLAGKRLAHGQTRLVHEGQGLDERQVKAAISALDYGRGVTVAALAAPAGPVGQPVEDHPADVVPRLLVLRARVAEAHDDLHRFSCESHRARRARSPVAARKTSPRPGSTDPGRPIPESLGGWYQAPPRVPCHCPECPVGKDWRWASRAVGRTQALGSEARTRISRALMPVSSTGSA